MEQLCFKFYKNCITDEELDFFLRWKEEGVVTEEQGQNLKIWFGTIEISTFVLFELA